MNEYFKYKPENAETHKALEIEGTSFQASYEEAEKMLGDLHGQTVLDFGSGAGRSSRFLKKLGAKKVIGIEHNETMINEAKSANSEGIEYRLVDKEIPIPDNSVDKAFASQVFMEMGSIEEMTRAMTEIARVLRPNCEFILIVTNPKAWGHDFVSYNYPEDPKDFKSGDPVICIIKGEKPFTIADYYWTEDDYRQALESSGFEIEEMIYPIPKSGEWLDETKVAPDIVIKTRKI